MSTDTDPNPTAADILGGILREAAEAGIDAGRRGTAVDSTAGGIALTVLTEHRLADRVTVHQHAAAKRQAETAVAMVREQIAARRAVAAPRLGAAPEFAIRAHLEMFCPPAGSEPHVWVAPLSASTSDREQWMDIGPLGEVCQAYPLAADILSRWMPCASLSLSGTVTLTPTLRVQASLIGESRRA